MAVVILRTHNVNGGHCQLARSLERILEEAHYSGELKLSNRKLKDFPKSATKYNLSDTVIADLSRNRFGELPEDVTSFAFLETLILYHNTIRTIPQSVKSLSSLTYLDLRSNQLSNLPREICFLPLQILLIANNRLISLPDELGRLEKLTDLDVSCNQLTSLPTRIGDLRNLRSLSLRNNQLIYLPREITYLTLTTLNLSSNRIASLPVEIRSMSTLVELNLENNPLTSPPVSLCVRGLVHVFKFLETQATKEEKIKSGGNYDGYTTLRRTPRNSNNIIDNCKMRRQNVDSGYSTSDGLDKRWSQNLPNGSPKIDIITQPDVVFDNAVMDTNITNQSSSNFKVGACIEDVINQSVLDNQFKKMEKNYINNTNASLSDSNSPEEEFIIDNQKSQDKNKNFGNIQTYKEYKEALKQQRNQEILAVYRAKSQKISPNSVENNMLDMSLNSNEISNSYYNERANTPDGKISNQQISSDIRNNVLIEDCLIMTKRPIQKVVPSRNVASIHSVTSKISDVSIGENGDCIDYVKPNSPIQCNGQSPMMNTSPIMNNSTSPIIKTNMKNSSLKSQTTKSQRNVSWNHELPVDKLSFTMRREFDKQKEETELITQLRTIIETRLKMNLPEDIASALMDGVILCHLANYVRPRSVGSIHVPSPGVPKLTMARCRRNVDNFLEACRKIGVDENLICCAADVLEGKGAVQIAITVGELFRFYNGQVNNIKSPTRTLRCNGQSLPSSSAMA